VVAESGKYKNMRLFTVARARSKTPLADCKGVWKSASPAAVADFSATAYYFGRNLTEVLDVPVGLISSSWGGSWIEAWMDAESIGGLASPSGNSISQTLMYHAMILPLVNYTIAGFIWYQGEANQVASPDYEALMTRMIALWRERWGNPDLPFYYAQIAPYVYGGVSEISSALLREQQLKALNSIPNVGMAVLLDQGDRTNIHPANKQVVGERLSYWALARTYGIEGIAYRSPEFKSMTIDGEKVAVEFDYAPDGLWPWDVPVDGFELAGENGVFFPATAWIDSNVPRNKVFVRSNQVRAPKYVRYGFWNYVNPDLQLLYNTAGLPASSFRTDGL
jgi:sialate O-acetylesterase